MYFSSPSSRAKPPACLERSRGGGKVAGLFLSARQQKKSLYDALRAPVGMTGKKRLPHYRKYRKFPKWKSHIQR